MRISDWSSDVCSSDLAVAHYDIGEQRLVAGDVVIGTEHTLATEGEGHVVGGHLVAVMELHARTQGQFDGALVDALPAGRQAREIGRASCGERVCQYG